MRKQKKKYLYLRVDCKKFIKSLILTIMVLYFSIYTLRDNISLNAEYSEYLKNNCLPKCSSSYSRFLKYKNINSLDF